MYIKGHQILRVLVMLCVFLSVVEAEEHLYCKTIKPKQYNDVWKRQFESEFRVNYSDQDSLFVIYSAEPISIFGFYLTHSQADSLVRIIDKYKEWNIKASKKKVTLDKEIAKLPTGDTFWILGDNWSYGPDMDIAIYFFSQSTKKHQLVMLFPEVTSYGNEFDTHKGETLYFDWNAALKLQRIFTKDYFNKFKKDLAKKKVLEEEFK